MAGHRVAGLDVEGGGQHVAEAVDPDDIGAPSDAVRYVTVQQRAIDEKRGRRQAGRRRGQAAEVNPAWRQVRIADLVDGFGRKGPWWGKDHSLTLLEDDQR